MPIDDDEPRLTTCLDSMLERLRRLELQVNRLVESQTVAAQDFVVVDERNQPRARFEMAGHSPQLIFFDRTGRERLRVGLHTDGTPAVWAEGREIPLVVVVPENTKQATRRDSSSPSIMLLCVRSDDGARRLPERRSPLPARAVRRGGTRDNPWRATGASSSSGNSENSWSGGAGGGLH